MATRFNAACIADRGDWEFLPCWAEDWSPPTAAAHVVRQVDLNAPDSRGLRPIHLAAIGGMSETVQALIRAGVPVDAMGVGGNTALHLAAYNRQDGVVAVLVGAGASPTQENSKGQTPVDLAQSETTTALMCQLHYAAERSMLDNLVALVAKGVPVNVLGRGGNTALHASAASGTPDAARLLLARGADPLRRNADGKTPLDLARKMSLSRPESGARSVEILEMLGRAEAEAVAKRAEAAARMEAEQAARPLREVYKEGEDVVYVRDGEEHPAVVMKVHRDDEEPYYTVRVLATGRERQTNANRLVRRQREEAEPDEGTQQEGEGGDQDAHVDGILHEEAMGGVIEGGADATGTTADAGTAESIASDACAGNSGKRTRRSDECSDNIGFANGVEATGARDHGEDDWARARELFLRVTTGSARSARSARSACREGTPSSAAGNGVPGGESGVLQGEVSALGVDPLRTLAAAFDASPVEKANDILSRSVAQFLLNEGEVGKTGDDLTLEPSRRKEVGDDDDGVVDNHNDRAAVAMDEGHEDVDTALSTRNRAMASSRAEVVVQGPKVSRERVAHAIAEACRDIVFQCLVTEASPVDTDENGEGTGGLGPRELDGQSRLGGDIVKSPECRC